MKNVKVVAALMMHENKVLIAARKKGEFEGLWEFPGGKIEAGETAKQAIKREIEEEMEIEITVDSYFMTREYDYPTFHLSMECFLCTPLSDHIHLNDHLGYKWIEIKKDPSINWVPADEEIFNQLIIHQQSL